MAWFWIASNTSAESMITSWRSHIAGENWYWDKKEEPYCSYIKIRKTKLFGCNFTNLTERPGRATEGEPIRFVSVIHHIILTNNKVVYKKSPFTQPSRKKLVQIQQKILHSTSEHYTRKRCLLSVWLCFFFTNLKKTFFLFQLANGCLKCIHESIYNWWISNNSSETCATVHTYKINYLN